MLSEVFERFVEKAPVAVMVRGILERVLGAPALDTLYDRVVDRQYTRQVIIQTPTPKLDKPSVL